MRALSTLETRPPAPTARRTAARSTLGAVLRRLRASRGWTLKEMSDRTGIPFSTLSKVEHDKLTLTYDRLLQLSRRLRIRLTDLFAEPEPGAQDDPRPVLGRRSLGDVQSALRIRTDNYDCFYLCPELSHKRFIPAVTHILARSLEEFGDLLQHDGEEFIYVLEGQVIVHTEFYEPVTLAPGQSTYLDSDMGHAYVLGSGCEAALILSVCSSPAPMAANGPAPTDPARPFTRPSP